jgi:transcriptional regulator with XRE-family HTH domain
MAFDSHRNLRPWREYRRLTQEQVVARLEIHEDPKLPTSRAQLSKMENGKSPYSQRLLEALAEIYDCDAWELLARNPFKEGEVVYLSTRLTDADKERAKAYIDGLNQARETA